MGFDLSSEFQKIFNRTPDRIYFCPGRVNLIGEHIDYNGGLVMPCAVSKGTSLAVSRNSDQVFRFRCINFPETADIPVQTSYTKTGREWFNYPLGVIHELVQQGHPLSGLDMLFYGDLPIGAGLSSSASIEVAMGCALIHLFNLPISLEALALTCKKVENDFIGVNSGIMDPFAVALGKEGKALLLDCEKLKYEYVPFEPGEFVLAIINTRKERKLADSKYNERFTECREALQVLQKEIRVDNLCEIEPAEFEKSSHLLTDPVLEKRARHVVYEQDRVVEAAEKLRNNELETFGQLMYASHHSLRELYEVSGKELDTIVEFCSHFEGCIGARMTGAGFGGCAIALVKKDSMDPFASNLSKYYKNRIGYSPEIFTSVASGGVRES